MNPNPFQSPPSDGEADGSRRSAPLVSHRARQAITEVGFQADDPEGFEEEHRRHRNGELFAESFPLKGGPIVITMLSVPGFGGLCFLLHQEFLALLRSMRAIRAWGNIYITTDEVEVACSRREIHAAMDEHALLSEQSATPHADEPLVTHHKSAGGTHFCVVRFLADPLIRVMLASQLDGVLDEILVATDYSFLGR